MAVDQMTVDLLKRLEGFSANAYNDHKQVSIGYGTRARPGETTITRAEAEQRLREEASKPAEVIERIVPGIEPARKAALISFGYNLGTGRGGLADLLPDAQAGNWDRVAQRMQRYIHASGEVNEGLVNRRAKEAALVAKGEIPKNQIIANKLKGSIGGTTQDSATVSPEDLESGTKSAKGPYKGEYAKLADALLKQNEALLARPTHWAQPLAAMVNAGMAAYYRNKDQEAPTAPATTAEQLQMAKMAAEIQKLQADAAKPIVVKQRDKWDQEIEVLVDPRTGRQVGLQQGEGDNLLQSGKAVTPQRAQQANTIVRNFSQGGAQQQPTQPRTAEGFAFPDYAAPRLSDQPQNAPQQQQPVQPSLSSVQQTPSDVIVGPAAEDKKVGEGYMQRTAPNGGFLWRQIGDRLVPVVMPKTEYETAARVREQAEIKKSTLEESRDKVARQFAGGLQRFAALPNEFGNASTANALGPYQGGSEGYNLPWFDIGTKQAAQAQARVNYLLGNKLSGNVVDPAEVRDRLAATSKNVAAVMKGLVRQPGEGAWTDKDQENLEAQIGKLDSSTSTADYYRRLDDLLNNTSKVLGADVRKYLPNGGIVPSDDELLTAMAKSKTVSDLNSSIEDISKKYSMPSDTARQYFEEWLSRKNPDVANAVKATLQSPPSLNPIGDAASSILRATEQNTAKQPSDAQDVVGRAASQYRDVGRTVNASPFGLPDQQMTNDGAFKRYQPQNTMLGSILGDYGSDAVDKRMNTVASPQIEAPKEDINSMNALRDAMMKKVVAGDQSTPKSDALPQDIQGPLPAIPASKNDVAALDTAKAELAMPANEVAAITDTLKNAGYDDAWITNYLTSMGYEMPSNYAMNGGY